MTCIAQQSGAGWLLHLEKTSNQVRKLVAILHQDFSLTPSGWWPPHGCCIQSWATIQISNSQSKTKIKITAYCQRNLIHLNLMAGVSLYHQPKETPSNEELWKNGQ